MASIAAVAPHPVLTRFDCVDAAGEHVQDHGQGVHPGAERAAFASKAGSAFAGGQCLGYRSYQVRQCAGCDAESIV